VGQVQKKNDKMEKINKFKKILYNEKIDGYMSANNEEL